MRIRLKTEALKCILSKIQYGQYKMMVLKVHYREISDISDQKERIEFEAVLNCSGQIIKANNRLARERAEELIGMGFEFADAAHLAFAEQSMSLMADVPRHFKIIVKNEKNPSRSYRLFYNRSF